MQNLMETQKIWATPIEVAEHLAISKRTVYRLAAEGHLTAIKVRGSLRIRIDSVQRYIDEQLQMQSLEID